VSSCAVTGSKVYEFYSLTTDKAAAQASCEAVSGRVLATVQSQAEQDLFVDMASDLGYTNVSG